MRAIWKGAVSFGLVSVPVKLYSATESHDISFRQVHAKDGGRIKYQRVCSIDGEEVAYADIAKGYETEDGEMVILDDEDLAQLPANSSREISVEKFVPSDQIDPMMLEKSYYLEPEKSGLKPYALLRDALQGERPGRGGHGVAADPDDPGRAARPRRRAGHADDDVARRDPRAADFGSLQDVEDAEAAGAEDGAAAPRHLGRRLRPQRVRGRLRRGRARARGGQARGRRGQAHQGARARRPARSSTCSPRCRSPSPPPRPPAARTRRRRSDEDDGGRRGRREARQEDREEGRPRSRPRRRPRQEGRHQEDSSQEDRPRSPPEAQPRRARARLTPARGVLFRDVGLEHPVAVSVAERWAPRSSPAPATTALSRGRRGVVQHQVAGPRQRQVEHLGDPADHGVDGERPVLQRPHDARPPAPGSAPARCGRPRSDRSSGSAPAASGRW